MSMPDKIFSVPFSQVEQTVQEQVQLHQAFTFKDIRKVLINNGMVSY